jgi:predicted secreted acid phosphatase
MTELGRRRGIVALAGVVALMVAPLVLVIGTADAGSRLPSKRQWLRDVDAAMAGSGKHLDRTIHGKHKKFAINLDIDNTSLATHYDPGAAVARVLGFVEHAHRHGVAILFNTARSGAPLKRARADLEAAGFPVTKICGRRPGEGSAHGKQRCRKRFVRQGFTIVANVGNRPTDFSGARNYGRAYRLPNYGLRLS